MIEVKDLGNYEFQISWDENDPLESQLNHWTEQDFIDAIKIGIEDKTPKSNELP